MQPMSCRLTVEMERKRGLVGIVGIYFGSRVDSTYQWIYSFNRNRTYYGHILSKECVLM